jgi:hypothetical protein
MLAVVAVACTLPLDALIKRCNLDKDCPASTATTEWACVDRYCRPSEKGLDAQAPESLQPPQEAATLDEPADANANLDGAKSAAEADWSVRFGCLETTAKVARPDAFSADFRAVDASFLFNSGANLEGAMALGEPIDSADAYACPQPANGPSVCNTGNGDDSAYFDSTDEFGDIKITGLSRKKGPWLFAFDDGGVDFETMYILTEGTYLGVPYLVPVPPVGMIQGVFSFLGAPTDASFVGISVRDCNGAYAPGVLVRGEGPAGNAQILYADQSAPLAGLNPSATQTDKSGAASSVVTKPGTMTYSVFHAGTGKEIGRRTLTLPSRGRYFIHFSAEPKPLATP